MIKKTILIAHQDEAIRKFFKKTLSWHFPLILVHHPQDILLTITDNSKSPYLLFVESDPSLPFNDIASLRLKLPSSTLILLSQPQNESHTVQGIRHGANGYILSPFHAQEIINLSR